ncbi:MAG: TolC family outer membrane protein [Proteobacteria bacterium]|nr:TolC family outer membrane protein [Pseudomonadota bacterium]
MIRRCFSGLAALVAVAAMAGPARAQSLEEAMIMAYTNNPTLLAARAELRSVDEQIAQALGGYRPTVSGTGSYGIERSETNISPWETQKPGSFGINLNQPIYSGGGTDASVSQADHVIEAQRANLIATEQQVLLDTVTTYMGVVLSRRLLDLAINNEERLARQLEATEDRFRVGEVTRTDVSQAKASYANAQAARVSAEGDLVRSRAQFEEVIGVPPTTLSTPGPLIGLPDDMVVAAEIAQVENPTIQAALASELAAQDTVDVRFADLLPSISLQASYVQSYDPSINITRQNIAQVVATLTIPIYQAGVAESLVRSAKQTAAQRRIEVDEARRAVQSNLVGAWQELNTSQAQIVAFNEEVDANQVALEGTQREADVGERTVLDVLDAEQALFQSQINLAVAQRDTVVASYALKSALGELTAQDLALPVAYYDVQLYYHEARDDWGFGGLFEGTE